MTVFVDGDHCLVGQHVFGDGFIDVDEEAAAYFLLTEVRAFHQAVAPHALVEGGEALLPVEEQ